MNLQLMQIIEVGLSEMIYSIQNRKKFDLLHVLNIIDAIHRSTRSGKKKITTLCEQPKPFNLKSIRKIINK